MVEVVLDYSFLVVGLGLARTCGISLTDLVTLPFCEILSSCKFDSRLNK